MSSLNVEVDFVVDVGFPYKSFFGLLIVKAVSWEQQFLYNVGEIKIQFQHLWLIKAQKI